MQRLTFWGLETARWGGGLPCEGVVAEKFVLSLESLSSSDFEERNLGCPRNFAGMSRTPAGVQKVCAKKFVRIVHSLNLVNPLLWTWTWFKHFRSMRFCGEFARGELLVGRPEKDLQSFFVIEEVFFFQNNGAEKEL